jgi:hypothetical protein
MIESSKDSSSLERVGNVLLIDDSNQLESMSAEAESSRRVVSTLNEKSLRNTSNLANNGLSSIEMSDYVKIYFEPLAKKFY